MPKSPAVAGFVYAIQSPESPRHVKLGLSSLAKLEPFLGSPAKFLDSQRAAEVILARQFPDLEKYASDPDAQEAYIRGNLKRHRRRPGAKP